MVTKEQAVYYLDGDAVFVGCERCKYCSLNLEYPEKLNALGCISDPKQCLGPKAGNTRNKEDFEYNLWEPAGENWIRYNTLLMPEGVTLQGWYNHETEERVVTNIIGIEDDPDEDYEDFDCDGQIDGIGHVQCVGCPRLETCKEEAFSPPELQQDQFVGDFEPYVTDGPYENWGDSITSVIKDALQTGVGVCRIEPEHMYEHHNDRCDCDFCTPQKNVPGYKEWFRPENQSIEMPEPKVEKDDINCPSHYAADGSGKIECWDHYELALSDEEFRGAMKNNIYKYIFRAGSKGETVKDLEKAIAYLKRWIVFEEGRRTVWMHGKKA